MRYTVIIAILFIGIFACVACKKLATENNAKETTEPQAVDPTQTNDPAQAPKDDFNFAQTVTATEADIVKALQGEWSSKENGFNYTLKIEGNQMTLGYSDRELGQIEYEVKPGMPIQIIPKTREFDQAKGRGYSEMYVILNMYYVNDRITLDVRPTGRNHELEDELVLSRGLTKEALDELEDIKPKPNLIYNTDSPNTAKTILQAIQGTWEGRDNCNETVIINDKDITVKSGSANVLSTKLHISDNNPAHIELDDNNLNNGNIHSDIFGLYYLDDTAILLSIHSDFMNHKFEYILRKPEYFGRFIMDKEVIPELEGEWKDQNGNTLTIHGNEMDYDGRKDFFHVKTYSLSDKEDHHYYIVSQANERYTFDGMFIPLEYKGGMLTTRMQIMDAPAPEVIFVRVQPQN